MGCGASIGQGYSPCKRNDVGGEIDETLSRPEGPVSWRTEEEAEGGTAMTNCTDEVYNWASPPLVSGSTASAPSQRRENLESRALTNLQRRHPYLTLPAHPLYQLTTICSNAISKEDNKLAQEMIGRIEQAVAEEDAALSAAFQRFNASRSGSLTRTEVQFMLYYLGFPSTESDASAVIRAVDRAGDGMMNLNEFQLYVGRMGGSEKLFEVRRQQMQAKIGHASGGGSAEIDLADLRQDLVETGIMSDAQAAWRLVVPPLEFVEAVRLVKCQRVAVRHIRTLAKKNHEAALPAVQQRAHRLKFSDTQLWMTLAWIRELAPIIVHLDLDKMIGFLEGDTHYRNQFETKSSGGLLRTGIREKWERDLFGGAYDGASGFNRPKYGVLNAMNDYLGVVKCKQYGDSYMILKNVRLRCTFSPEDSANLKADRLAVLDFYAHVLAEYDDKELEETVKVANSGEAVILGDSRLVGNMKYKETQIHGQVSFAEHVERLVAADRHRSQVTRLETLCNKHGWRFSWMSEERHRMEQEEKEKLGAAAWKERLASLMDKGVPDAPGVPEGYCRTGCGRPVCPGLTPGGKPYKTCCRGCILGFGHDLLCGKIDPSLLGEGKCGRGCGRKVARGVQADGRAYTTCCRGCAMGLEHSPVCGMDPDVAEATKASMCKMLCGRKAAVGPNGRKFATCCRGCALGTGHSSGCC